MAVDAGDGAAVGVGNGAPVGIATEARLVIAYYQGGLARDCRLQVDSARDGLLPGWVLRIGMQPGRCRPA